MWWKGTQLWQDPWHCRHSELRHAKQRRKIRLKDLAETRNGAQNWAIGISNLHQIVALQIVEISHLIPCMQCSFKTISHPHFNHFTDFYRAKTLQLKKYESIFTSIPNFGWKIEEPSIRQPFLIAKVCPFPVSRNLQKKKKKKKKKLRQLVALLRASSVDAWINCPKSLALVRFPLVRFGWRRQWQVAGAEVEGIVISLVQNAANLFWNIWLYVHLP